VLKKPSARNLTCNLAEIVQNKGNQIRKNQLRSLKKKPKHTLCELKYNKIFEEHFQLLYFSSCVCKKNKIKKNQFHFCFHFFVFVLTTFFCFGKFVKFQTQTASPDRQS
jgi:hypothetical protein